MVSIRRDASAGIQQGKRPFLSYLNSAHASDVHKLCRIGQR